MAIWTYIRTETTGAAKTSGFGYRVSPSYRFGEKNATGLFVDMFFGLSSYSYVSFPNRNERASGTFVSVGLSHAFAHNHALDASLGLFRTIGPMGEGIGFQPSLAYSVFLQRVARPLRSPKPKRFKNPSQCPESFD
ncbi:MAG: hypothetical protein EAZ91_17405 [Cytophagales bacterium]|nr:MAG: hypothetical protein EAZ91_17405 [Cytophagales bacterium]